VEAHWSHRTWCSQLLTAPVRVWLVTFEYESNRRLTFPRVVVRTTAAFHSKVLVGSYNLFLDGNLSVTFKRTVLPGTRILHPDYDHFAQRNDLMLFKIDPVPIKPAELNVDPAAPAPGQAFTVIGFGEVTPNSSATDPPEYPATLQKVRQFVVEGATCQQRWGIDASFIDNRTMICAEANSTTPSGVCGGTSTSWCVSRRVCSPF
jgi:Trypsin